MLKAKFEATSKAKELKEVVSCINSLSHLPCFLVFVYILSELVVNSEKSTK